MNDIKLFSNTEFGNLGILTINGKEFFPATHCAKLLGYKNPQDAVRMRCKGVSKFLTPTAGGLQEANYIPEGDLYRLIVNSKLPSAERFERWIFDEVLPSIRKKGGYNSVQDTELMNRIKMLEAAVTALTEDFKGVQREDVLMLTEKVCVERIDCKTVEQLPPHIRAAVDCMIDRNCCIGAVLDFLDDNNVWISFKSVKKYIGKRKAVK